jgi:DNA processing protein
MSSLNAKYWHCLNLIIPNNLWKLLRIKEFSHDPGRFFQLTENQLLEAGLDPSLSKQIIAGRIRLNPAIEWERLAEKGIYAISWHDPLYPKQLAEIPSPPPLLYIRGRTDILSQPGLAVVGTRKITTYGKQAINTLIPGLSAIGLNIISGMAIGVDAEALTSCLESGGAPIGVLASSIDDPGITPKTNLALAKKIIDRGCLISEIPPGANVYKTNFPQRNRIVSGLALGTLVIEAAKNSGSLITANFALEQNREVFAVPGPIFSQSSSGTLSLIKRGAKCVTETADIIKEFGWDIEIKPKQLRLANPLHQLIFALLTDGPAPLNSLIQRTHKPAGEIIAALTELEIIGMVKQPSPGVYATIK